MPFLHYSDIETQKSQSTRVVLNGRPRPLKIVFRLWLQNLFNSLDPPSVANGKWLAVVLCCACLRVEVMVSMSARCSKGGGYGFDVGEISLSPKIDLKDRQHRLLRNESRLFTS
jgi:hypothetical protein